MDRPARVQVSESDLEKAGDVQHQPGQVYNIWYDKWAGGDRDPNAKRRRSPYKCNPEKDTGYTKGSKVKGSYFCLHFARGMCYKGEKCSFLHRLPTDTDVFAASVDCFGRDKFAHYRDDMSGVGSFLRENRTLFVGYLDKSKDSQGLVRRAFKQWGPIAKIKKMDTRGIYFVTFESEIYAQFAKEAMAHQTITGKETLVVRWASHDDDETADDRAVRTIKRLLEEPAAKVQPDLNQTEPAKETGLISSAARKKLKLRSVVTYSDSE